MTITIASVPLALRRVVRSTIALSVTNPVWLLSLAVWVIFHETKAIITIKATIYVVVFFRART